LTSGHRLAQEIYNAREVHDDLITAGQPTEEQLRAVAAAGFTTVINLATYHPKASLQDEAGLVKSLGMLYHHIPVAWDDPRESDFSAFEALMQQLPSGDRVLLHCAANFRVTAFYALYAMKHLGWSEEQADAFRASIWRGSNYPVWERFVTLIKSQIGVTPP
jgi:protein tyrosine phosphatase (PTP) superfamily phosphohydrolase (DUF442 family)